MYKWRLAAAAATYIFVMMIIEQYSQVSLSVCLLPFLSYIFAHTHTYRNDFFDANRTILLLDIIIIINKHIIHFIIIIYFRKAILQDKKNECLIYCSNIAKFFKKKKKKIQWWWTRQFDIYFVYMAIKKTEPIHLLLGRHIRR